MDHPKVRKDQQGNLFLNFGKYGEEVEVAAISGDGRRVLTVREVGVAQVWEVESGNLLVEIRPESPLTGSLHSAPAPGPFVVFIEGAALNQTGSLALLGLNDEVLSFEAPFRFETHWALSSDGTRLCIGATQAVFRYDLMSGALERTIAADILRPERFPPAAMVKEHRIRGGAMLWRTPQGLFLHQCDGPRGWVEPLDLSLDGLVALPCESGAAVLKIDATLARMLGTVPFEGKLRAGRVAGDEVLLVNERGRCFRWPLSELQVAHSEI